MPTIAIIHHSGTGKTTTLANAVAAGAASVAGATVQQLSIVGADISEGRYKNDAHFAALDAADAIIFGSPTYMGMVSGQFKAFADATAGRWFQQSWKNKLAGGFTTSGGYSGDKQGTLIYLSILAAQHAMLWVSQAEMNGIYLGKPEAEAVNRIGSSLGVMGQAAPTPEGVLTPGDLETGRLYGIRIAELASQ